jgi:NAD(P)H-hydrate epimerase
MKKVSKEQMARIDEKVPEKYGITISRMMENAAYQIAEFIRSEIDPEGVAVYAGKGNNGGDALAAARRLHLWGFEVEVVLATEELDGIRKEELEILEELGIEINTETAENNYSIALEGLIGYNLNGDPRPPFDSMIEEVNQYDTVVSIDLPTGVDADTGEKSSPTVKPDYTVTLAMPKKGMNRENSGEIWVADISIPPGAYEEFGFGGDIFEEKSLIRL